MLGLRRVGVTSAARSLQQDGLIRYSRGNITILDRKGLEAACCSCYELVKDMHEPARTCACPAVAPKQPITCPTGNNCTLALADQDPRRRSPLEGRPGMLYGSKRSYSLFTTA